MHKIFCKLDQVIFHSEKLFRCSTNFRFFITLLLSAKCSGWLLTQVPRVWYPHRLLSRLIYPTYWNDFTVKKISQLSCKAESLLINTYWNIKWYIIPYIQDIIPNNVVFKNIVFLWKLQNIHLVRWITNKNNCKILIVQK